MAVKKKSAKKKSTTKASKATKKTTPAGKKTTKKAKAKKKTSKKKASSNQTAPTTSEESEHVAIEPALADDAASALMEDAATAQNESRRVAASTGNAHEVPADTDGKASSRSKNSRKAAKKTKKKAKQRTKTSPAGNADAAPDDDAATTIEPVANDDGPQPAGSPPADGEGNPDAPFGFGIVSQPAGGGVQPRPGGRAANRQRKDADRSKRKGKSTPGDSSKQRGEDRPQTTPGHIASFSTDDDEGDAPFGSLEADGEKNPAGEPPMSGKGAGKPEAQADSGSGEAADDVEATDEERQAGKGRRRRGKRGGRKNRRQKEQQAEASSGQKEEAVAEDAEAATDTDRKASRNRTEDDDRHSLEPMEEATAALRQLEDGDDGADEAPAGRKKRSRRGGRKKKHGRSRKDEANDEGGTSESAGADDAEMLVPTVDEFNPDADEDDDVSATTGTREMLVNISAGDECRIAVMHEGRLEELFLERQNTQSMVGNIYKGRVTNVESSIQAAFIDFGTAKNGFLHISDVQPQYFGDKKNQKEDVGRKIPRHHRPPIQDCFRRGQEVIVQITKDGLGTKGPTLTTYLSLPGRFLVMMPGMNKLGVSRKIEDDGTRRKMRAVLDELSLPGGMGYILRTAGIDRTKRDLQRDLNYLMRLWRTVVDRVKREPAPAELYRESDLVTRTIRDVYSNDFRRLVIDDAATAEKAKHFLQIVLPRAKSQVQYYADREPLFHRMGIEAELERINSRHVPLPSGGSIVIDQTEAMVTIDVNSGRYRKPEDAEETAVRINLEAADEIARQLRLRDLGGLIVCDFIDMRFDRNKRQVERAVRDALKKHKERARILRMSAFGLIEITRQRRGPSMKRNMFFDCPHCKGSGLVKLPESVMLDAIRLIQLAAHRKDVSRIKVTVAADVAYQILNEKRAVLNEVETETGKEVLINGDANYTPDEMNFRCEDAQGRSVKFNAGLPPVGGVKSPVPKTF